MMASTTGNPARVEPMPARRRYGIATTSSLAVHMLVLLVVGLFAARTPVRPEVLIPVELTMTGQAGDQVELGGGGHPEATPKESLSPSAAPTPVKKPPSSPGVEKKAAPAAPKVLTSEGGTEPVGAVDEGKEKSGAGGEAETPAGPTTGPGVMGGTPPIYPKDALDRGLAGTVSLAVDVAPDGSISSVAVAKSSGHEVLDHAAIRAVRRDWTFQPGLKEGEPAPGSVTITFEFTSGKVAVK
ncbi:MAG: energy transducer TonB [Armatimonadetes bacterium]|nr:energy transducer TonB [Armatimonadota bacterium]